MIPHERVLVEEAVEAGDIAVRQRANRVADDAAVARAQRAHGERRQFGCDQPRQLVDAGFSQCLAARLGADGADQVHCKLQVAMRRVAHVPNNYAPA